MAAVNHSTTYNKLWKKEGNKMNQNPPITTHIQASVLTDLILKDDWLQQDMKP